MMIVSPVNVIMDTSEQLIKFSCIKCAEANRRGRIDPTWHVALCNANTNEMICSGAATNNRWVLTSAGCVCDGIDKQLGLVNVELVSSVKVKRCNCLPQKFTVT